MSSGQSMTRAVMIGQNFPLLSAATTFTPWSRPKGPYQARVTPESSAAIDLVCQELCPKSRSQVKQAWQNYSTLYCRHHAVDGWAPAKAKALFAEANSYLETGPDGHQYKVTASRTTLQRRWTALVEAGLIHEEVRGHVRLHITHVTLPGVLDHNGGFKPHADRVIGRLESRRRSASLRRERALQGNDFSSALNPASGSESSGPGYANAPGCLKPPKLSLLSPTQNKKPEHKDTSRPTPYGPSAPLPSPEEAFSPPNHSSIEPNPNETEDRRRTRVEHSEARLPLTPKTQPKPQNLALSHDPPVQPPPPLRREAPAQHGTAVAAPKSHPPARAGETPKPTGYDGVRAKKDVTQGHVRGHIEQASAPSAPPAARIGSPKPGQAALNAFLASQGLPPIPDRPPATRTQMARFAEAMSEVPTTFHRQHVPDGAPLDPAERDMRRPWTFDGHAYDALCELKYRRADEATARKMLSPTAMKAVLGLRSWADWMGGDEADVPLGWAAQAFEAYAALVRARRADLRLPDGPPKDPVAMVRFLEAVTCPRAAAYAFNGQAIVKMGLSAKALLSAVEQADEAFEKGNTGPGKAYARYFQGIAVRLAESGATG